MDAERIVFRSLSFENYLAVKLDELKKELLAEYDRSVIQQPIGDGLVPMTEQLHMGAGLRHAAQSHASDLLGLPLKNQHSNKDAESIHEQRNEAIDGGGTTYGKILDQELSELSVAFKAPRMDKQDPVGIEASLPPPVDETSLNCVAPLPPDKHGICSLPQQSPSSAATAGIEEVTQPCATPTDGNEDYPRSRQVQTLEKNLTAASQHHKAIVKTPTLVKAPTSLTVSCTTCGSMLTDGEVYCRECGAAQRPPDSTSRKCVCGNNLMKDALFCRRCGLKVGTNAEQVICAKCNSCLMHDANFCRKCGHKKGLPLGSQSKELTHLFVLHQVWQSGADQKYFVHMQTAAITGLKNKLLASSVGTRLTRFQELWSKIAMTPSSLRRVTWDCLQLVLLAYDAIVLPMQFLNLPRSTFNVFMRWLIRVYWTLDIPLDFATGYYTDDGRLEIRPSAVALNYTKSWLIFDVVMATLDWISAAANLDTPGGHMTVALAVLRMARLMRVIRLFRIIPDVLESIGYFFRDNSIPLLMGVAQIVIFILYINHVIACVWYGLGTSGNDESTWLRANGIRDMKNPIANGYVVAWHWSLTQFIGTMEVNPENPTERIYAISVLSFAMMVMCVLPARVTSLMTQLQLITAEREEQLSKLNEFLYVNGISRRLALEVHRNAYRALNKTSSRHEKDVAGLALISEPLLVEMHYEMYAKHLMKHAFFRQLANGDSNYYMAFQQICHKAVAQTNLAQDDLVFCTGEFPDKPVMYFLLKGELAYREFGNEEEQVFKIRAGEWLSEGTLWTPWVHRGLVWAMTPCSLLMLRAHEFQDILTKFMSPQAEPRKYGELFVAKLNKSDFGKISDLNSFDVGEIAHVAFGTEGGQAWS